MAYFKPYIDESGFHYPTYNEILEELIDDMQTIYGSGIYLGNDSQDYQMLSKISEKIYDTYQVAEVAYHTHSPATSIGAGLDYVVAINGIQRRQATKSVAKLTLTGIPRTVIENGIVADASGILWDLPESAVIGDDGTVEVEATCREFGRITADAGSINKIMTPIYGWNSVINTEAADVGTITETDAELRARQAISVSLPSRSIYDGLMAELMAVDDIGRVMVYENDTNQTDSDGIPPHSICCVVEGAEDYNIAETIFKRKGPGCGTYGSESSEVTDENGHSHTICFDRLSYADVDIEINITKRQGWSDSIPDQITTAIINYLDTFSIGTDLTVSIIWMVAQEVNADARTPQFSITSVTAARAGETLSLEDVVIAYNEAARARTGNITVNVRG